MKRILDAVVYGTSLLLMIMGIYHLVMHGVFEPVQLSAGISSLLTIRVAHEHAPRFIKAKWKERITP